MRNSRFGNAIPRMPGNLNSLSGGGAEAEAEAEAENKTPLFPLLLSLLLNHV